VEVNTSLVSESYSSVDTSSCERQDAHDFRFNSNGTNLGWFNEWLVWEGGIAFHSIYWIVILLLSLINLLRWKLRWQCLTERFVGQSEPYHQKKKSSRWIFIDEEALGKDGATYLWFQVGQIVVYTWLMIFSCDSSFW
jgi:hypothetical protein